MMITMVISGIWHGAALTSIYWAFLHALYLKIERLSNWQKWLAKIPLGKIFSALIVFVFVTLAWNYFRAETIGQAVEVYNNVFSFRSSDPYFLKYFNAMVFLIMAISIELLYLLYSSNITVKKLYRRANLDVIMVVLALISCLYLRGPAAEFIYFQF